MTRAVCLSSSVASPPCPCPQDTARAPGTPNPLAAETQGTPVCRRPWWGQRRVSWDHCSSVMHSKPLCRLRTRTGWSSRQVLEGQSHDFLLPAPPVSGPELAPGKQSTGICYTVPRRIFFSRKLPSRGDFQPPRGLHGVLQSMGSWEAHPGKWQPQPLQPGWPHCVTG